MKIPIEGPLTVEKEPLNYWVSYNLLHGNYKLFISERRKEMSKDTFQLQDKVVAITGASSGFGYLSLIHI